MKHVVTVHGINSKGQWQERAEQVLAPHFSCINVKYAHYRSFGFLKVIVEPWILIPVLLLLLILSMTNMIHWTWGIWSVLLSGLLIVSHLFTYVRRELALRIIKTQIDSKCPPGERPHVIAHSFGTFLIGSLMKRFPDIQFDAVILTGCVLPAGFDWQSLKGNKVSGFCRVRNEVADGDQIVRLASLLRRLIPGMGSAGVTGFHEASRRSLLMQGDVISRANTIDDLIHTVDIRNRCLFPDCNGRAGIHNVRLPHDFSHNDSFTGTGHAATFWLPFLWNIDDAEYSDLLEACHLASELKRQKDQVGLRVMEEFFTTKLWDWADTQTVVGFIESQLLARQELQQGQQLTPATKDIVYRALVCFWDVITDATKTKDRSPQDPKSKHQMLSLYPRIAVAKALDSIIKTTQRPTNQQPPRGLGRGFEPKV